MCRELNAADEALWQHGKTLHAAALQKHKEDGTLAAVSAGALSLRSVPQNPLDHVVVQ